MFFRFVTKHACDVQADYYDPQDRASIAASRCKKANIVVVLGFRSRCSISFIHFVDTVSDHIIIYTHGCTVQYSRSGDFLDIFLNLSNHWNHFPLLLWLLGLHLYFFARHNLFLKFFTSITQSIL